MDEDRENAEDRKIRRRRAVLEISIGAVLVVVGVAVQKLTTDEAMTGSWRQFFVIASLTVGALIITVGVPRLFGVRLPLWLMFGMAGAHVEAERLRREERLNRGFGAGADRAVPIHTDVKLVMALRKARRARGLVELFGGVALIIAGIIITLFTYKAVAKSGGTYLIAYGPVVVGFVALVRGTLRLLNLEEGLAKPSTDLGTQNTLNVAFGFKSFVAWRYLMARHHRVSRIVLSVFFLALFIGVVSVIAGRTLITVDNPLGLEPASLKNLARAVLIATVVGSVLLYFSIIVGLLRYVFSFFTTVPLVGVWIGTGALVCVLSVMSGFETDLRQKILGSNAHIQVTREDGEFVNWREVKGIIDKVPGVRASTPYAVSEVVIAANNNGMNVIIKGIDPATVGNVTKLISSLEDKDAMKRLEPLVDDTEHLVVPQQPGQGSGAIDPPPDDMPTPGDPIDFSKPRSDVLDPDQPPPAGSARTPIDDEPPSPDLPSGSASDQPGGAAPDAGSTVKQDEFGGDAAYLVASEPVVDPPPPDIVTSGEPPIDYSGSDADLPIHVIDVPLDQPSLSRRTQSLPGILVGRELVKQTHLYTGEEVRIVSPLSDPSNPDATGTPIPFNRDYRVAGIFFTGMYEYDLKYVYVTLDSLTDFLDRGDVVDGIEVRIGDPDDTDTYVARLGTLLGKDYRIQDWKELNRSLFAALKLEKIAMFLVLGIVILVASFSIVGNLIMVVVEKAREIALLKTLGASDTSVMQVFAIQGLLIGFVGTALGVGTGLLACWFGKEYGIPLNPDVYYIDRMPVNVDSSSVLVTAAAGVVISMAATFYPALVAARVRPAAGMRH